MGNWLVEGILLSVLFGVGVLMSGQHLNRFLEGIYIVICLATVAWVIYKFIRFYRKQKQA